MYKSRGYNFGQFWPLPPMLTLYLIAVFSVLVIFANPSPLFVHGVPTRPKWESALFYKLEFSSRDVLYIDMKVSFSKYHFSNVTLPRKWYPLFHNYLLMKLRWINTYIITLGRFLGCGCANQISGPSSNHPRPPGKNSK